jgi:hypothetical protein
MTLTPAETALWTTRLTEAQTAYNALVTGQSARVVVDQNGERVEFTAARKTDLYNYIAQLQAGLGICSPIAMMPSRPATFIF